MFGLVFGTVPGGRYQLEYKDNLAAPTWTPLGSSQTATSTTLTVADDCNFFSNQHRFYRVVRLP